jgi:hypothetical protein
MTSFDGTAPLTCRTRCAVHLVRHVWCVQYVFNFNHPGAIRCLTQCILREDFDLDVHIPDNSLVPRVRCRLHYIQWLQRLLQHTQLLDAAAGPVWGADVGKRCGCAHAHRCRHGRVLYLSTVGCALLSMAFCRRRTRRRCIQMCVRECCAQQVRR